VPGVTSRRPGRPVGSSLVLDQVTPEQLLEVCGEDPTWICREVLERTESRRWAELADIVFAKPLTITVILAVSWLVIRLLDRAIERFVDTMSGEAPATRRIKRRLRKTKVGQRLPQSVLATGPYSPRVAARAHTLGAVLRSVTRFVVWTIAAVTILGELGVNLGPLIASAGIAGLAIGFGAQTLVRDFLAGIFILIEDQYGVGDIVDVGEASGTVEAVTLRTTRLRDVNGTVWYVPNGEIVRVGNMSQEWARGVLDVLVSYGADLDLAKATIKDVADDLWRDPDFAARVLEHPELWGVEDLGPTGVTIRLVVKTKPAAQWAVMRELRSRIKAALDERGIEIPQRAVVVQPSSEPAKRPRKAAARPKKAAKKAT